MGSYYYLMAQLPFLIYEQKPPMSSGAFKALAESLLSEEDVVLMGCLSLDPEPPPASLTTGSKGDSLRQESSKTAGDGRSYAESAPSTGCSFIDSWREWERTLRLNLAKYRAVKTRRETIAAEPPFMPVDAVVAAAKAVTGEGSPLENEIFIDKARWSAIDAIAGNRYFDRDNVYAYFLKLMLLERRMSFNAEDGFSEYKSLYADIIESSQNYGHNSLGEPK